MPKTPREEWEETLQQSVRKLIRQAFTDYLANTHTAPEPHVDEAAFKITRMMIKEVNDAVERCNDRHHWNSGGINWND